MTDPAREMILLVQGKGDAGSFSRITNAIRSRADAAVRRAKARVEAKAKEVADADWHCRSVSD